MKFDIWGTLWIMHATLGLEYCWSLSHVYLLCIDKMYKRAEWWNICNEPVGIVHYGCPQTGKKRSPKCGQLGEEVMPNALCIWIWYKLISVCPCLKHYLQSQCEQSVYTPLDLRCPLLYAAVLKYHTPLQLVLQDHSRNLCLTTGT